MIKWSTLWLSCSPFIIIISLACLGGEGCTSADSGGCAVPCVDGLVCVVDRCLSPSCSDHSECQDGALCEQGVCRDDLECIMSSDCDPNHRCVEGQCYQNECEDGESGECSSECGAGTRRCISGVWRACNAPEPDDSGLCPLPDCQEDDTTLECRVCEESAEMSCQSACGEGVTRCQAGQWLPCDAPAPDEVGRCPCETEGEEASCDTTCGPGQMTCIEGLWGACLFMGQPCECTEGEERPCDSLCGPAVERCEEGSWGDCLYLEGEPEICGDLMDQDCDGVSDEGCQSCIGMPTSAVLSNEPRYDITGYPFTLKSRYFDDRRWALVSAQVPTERTNLYSLGSSDLNVGQPTYINQGISESLFPWRGEVGALLSQGEESLQLMRFTLFGSERLSRNYPHRSGGGALAVDAGSVLYLVWSDSGQEVYARALSSDDGAPLGEPINLSDAPGESTHPSGAVSDIGLGVVYEDHRDADPLGPWLYLNTWRHDQRPSDSLRMMRGERPQLLWSRGAYHLVSSRGQESAYDLIGVQFNSMGEALNEIVTLTRSIDPLTPELLRATNEGYVVIWSVLPEISAMDPDRVFYLRHLDELGQPTGNTVRLYQLPRFRPYTVAYHSDRKEALISWMIPISLPEPFGLDPNRLNSITLDARCAQ
jgi:hypothetical protein